MRPALRLCPIAVLLATQPAVAAAPVPLKPANDPGTWVTTDDYPRQALMLRQQGKTAFRLDVDPAGSVGRCVVTASSGSATLDQTTCDLLRARARFEPARNRSGAAVAGTYSSAVRWQIPRSTDPRASMLGCATGPIGDVRVWTGETCMR